MEGITMSTWVSTWGQAHTDITHMSPCYKNRTMRIPISNNLKGEKIRIRVSNQEGKKPLQIIQASIQRDCESQIPVTFHEKKSLDLLPGEERYSDNITLPVNAGDRLVISMAFTGSVISGNGIVECIQCSKNGNYVEASQFQTIHRNMTSCYHGMPQAIPVLSSIEVLTSDEAGAIICFGDSITQQSTWTMPLAKAFLQLQPGLTSVINKGIGGNRLLKGPLIPFLKMYGKSGISRFQRDVLDEAGAKAVIIAMGTNDIGMSRNPKKTEWVTTKQLANALEKLTREAREKNLTVYGSTLLPRSGTIGYLPSNEEERLKFNQWIRTTNIFDHVFDFDSVVRNPSLPDTMAFSCDSGDHLHPNSIGGEKIAQLIVDNLIK